MTDLVSFEDNNILLNEDIYDLIESKKLTTVAIIGRARKGKSTFLNSIISFIQEENRDIFTTSKLGIHCTHGIKYFIYNNYLFIDCEGIMKDDSHNDLNLLLLTYHLSDFIIFNDLGDFDNSSIAQLTGLCSFSSIQLKEHKPTLIIRIADYELERDIHESLNSTINITRDDSYQGIRDSIKKLFNNEIYIFPTNSLDRKDRIELNDKKFTIDIFSSTCKNIIKIISEHKSIISGNQIYINLKQLISKLNNEKINIRDLDITNVIHEKIINDFIEKIDVELYYPINITSGSQEEYTTFVLYKSKIIENILDNYSSQFSTIPSELFTIKYEYLKNKLYKEILKAQDECQLIYCMHESDIIKDIMNFISKLIYDLDEKLRCYEYKNTYIFEYDLTSIDKDIKHIIDYKYKYYYAYNIIDDFEMKIHKLIELIKFNIDKVNEINHIKDEEYKKIIEHNTKPESIYEFIDKNANDPTKNIKQNIYDKLYGELYWCRYFLSQIDFCSVLRLLFKYTKSDIKPNFDSTDPIINFTRFCRRFTHSSNYIYKEEYKCLPNCVQLIFTSNNLFCKILNLTDLKEFYDYLFNETNKNIIYYESLNKVTFDPYIRNIIYNNDRNIDYEKYYDRIMRPKIKDYLYDLNDSIVEGLICEIIDKQEAEDNSEIGRCENQRLLYIDDYIKIIKNNPNVIFYKFIECDFLKYILSKSTICEWGIYLKEDIQDLHLDVKDYKYWKELWEYTIYKGVRTDIATEYTNIYYIDFNYKSTHYECKTSHFITLKIIQKSTYYDNYSYYSRRKYVVKKLINAVHKCIAKKKPYAITEILIDNIISQELI